MRELGIVIVVLVVALWLLLPLYLAPRLASQKGRNPWIALLFALAFGWFGLLLVIFIPPNERELFDRQMLRDYRLPSASDRVLASELRDPLSPTGEDNDASSQSLQRPPARGESELSEAELRAAEWARRQPS